MYSLCLTNHERYDMLIESFQQVLDDPRISEIIISDDCSSEKIYNSIVEYSKDKPKIKLFRNESNVGMGENKKRAVERASQQWCILFDSDNRLGKEYLHALYQQPKLHPNVIYVPESGGDRLDYSRFSKLYICRRNIEHFLTLPSASMLLNTCNYIVNRDRYLQVYQYNREILGSDTIWFNYLWLKDGGAFVVVPGMRYYHRVHAGSGFMQNLNYNVRKCTEIEDLIRGLHGYNSVKQ